MDKEGKMLRMIVVGHMLDLIREQITQYLDGRLSTPPEHCALTERLESIGFCDAMHRLLTDTQELLCESAEDPALAALAPHLQSPSKRPSA